MTQLSNELWNIKASEEEPVWKMLGQYQPYNININGAYSALMKSCKWSLIEETIC